MRSFSNFLMFFLCSILLINCNKTDKNLAGYTNSKTGLQYKFHIDEEGQAAGPGDRVVYHMSFRKGDTTVVSSHEQGFPIDVRLPKDTTEDFDGNYLLQALSLMSKGDSLSYVRLVDSIPANARPPAFKEGDYIFFDISMKNTQTLSAFEAEKKELLSTFEQTPHGLYHKFAENIDGRAAKPEEGVRYNLRIRKSTHSVYSTYETNQPNGFQLPPAGEMEAALMQNPILDALALMSPGDSLNIILFSDSLQGALRPEWGFQSGDLVKMDLKLIEIKTKKEIQAERAKAEAQKAEQEKLQNAAFEANRKVAEKVDEKVQKIIKEYKSGGLKTESTASGLKFIVTEKGSGNPLEAGQRISVNYSGHLLDGKRFDSSFAKGAPYPLTLGTGAVIAGWDEGLALMNAGDKGYLFIPASLGYGETGSPPQIPGNSELVFYVEIVNNQK